MLWSALVAGLLSIGIASAQDAAKPEAKKEEGQKGWESSAGAGLSLTKGNSDTMMANINAQSSRKWTRDEVLTGASFNYGETDGEKTTESFQAFGQYNHLFTERLYGGLRLDFLHDDMADLDYRFTVSPVLGYYFIKQPNTFLSAEVGPAFIYERQAGEDHGYFAARIGERFEHKFSEKAKVWESLEFLPQVDDVENYLLNAEIGAEAALTAKLALRVVFQDTYDNVPAPGLDKNDMKLIASLVYKF